MSAEWSTHNMEARKYALTLRAGCEEINPYIRCVVTKASQTKIEGDRWKTKALIVQQSSFTMAERANKSQDFYLKDRLRFNKSHPSMLI